MHDRTAHEHSFTLLEPLVTLVVIGLLMVTLTEGTRVGLRAWALEGQSGLRVGRLEATDRALRQLLERASSGEANQQGTAFSGTPHALKFVTTLPDGSGAQATHEAEITLSVTDGHRLTLLWRPHYRRWIVPPQRLSGRRVRCRPSCACA
jgi:general secretion pathway protein J